jgi:carboxypeptidase C (cathepsin A)
MAYLNRDDVKAALHVEKSLAWAICSSVNYKSNILDVVFVYNELLKAKKRVLIYNGNTDMSVPYTGTRAWMAHETNWTVTRPLQGWSFTDPAYPWGPQQGGFAVQYEADLWFTLVNGAGHMVPQFRPPAAFAMFERFITKRGF